MKKIINLLEAYGVEVFQVGTNYFVHEGEQEVSIDFWDEEDVFDFLGYTIAA